MKLSRRQWIKPAILIFASQVASAQGNEEHEQYLITGQACKPNDSPLRFNPGECRVRDGSNCS